MNHTSYRLIFEGLDPGAQLPKVVTYFQKELGLSENAIRNLLTAPPRVLCEVSNENNGVLMQKELTRLGCLITAEPAVSHPSLPFFISRDLYKIMNQELSKILRVRSNLAFCLAQVTPAGSETVLPSLLGKTGEQITGHFRESDTVLRIDDSRLVILAFSTDKEGVGYLENKVKRALKDTIGEEIGVSTGFALFPQEGKNLVTLLSFAEQQRKNGATESQIGSGEKATEGKTDVEPLDDQADARYLEESLVRARGKILQRLNKVRPEVLWQGLSQIPQTNQREFLAKLPFDSPLVPVLGEMIDRQSAPISDEKSRDHLQAIIHQLDKAEGSNGATKAISEELISKLNRVEALPTLPTIAAHIFKIASNPDASAQDLTALIQNDPPLTSKLLKIVNSAFYGFPQKIGNVKQAVVILGTDEIMDLSFGLAAAKVFEDRDGEGMPDPKELWRHSMGTALISQKLCVQMPQCERLGGFTAGLLHDFGKIFLLDHFAEPYSAIHHEFAQDGVPLFELEEKHFGIHHANVGERLANHWNLPKALAKAIAYHHQPFSATEHGELAALVGFADYLYHRVALEQETEEPVATSPLLTVGHWDVLNEHFHQLSVEKIDKMADEAKAILEQNTHLFAILDG